MSEKKFIGVEGLQKIKQFILDNKVDISNFFTEEQLAEKLKNYATSEALNTAKTELDQQITKAKADVKKEVVAEIVGEAPQTYDTLQEIAEYIEEHKSVETALNAAIGAKADASKVTELEGRVGTVENSLKSKVDKDELEDYVTETELEGALDEIKELTAQEVESILSI